MSHTITWMIVKERSGPKEIGAIAFVGDDPAVVITFYEEHDSNKDGEVSLKEAAAGFLFPVSMVGTASAEVITRARFQATLMIADHNPGSGTLPNAEAKAKKLLHMQGNQFQAIALNMAPDGIFKAYLAPGIGRLGSAIGTQINAGMVKGVLINKGMSKAAKLAFDAVVKPG